LNRSLRQRWAPARTGERAPRPTSLDSKRRFTRAETDAWLGERGVVLIGADLDESPMAYRRLPEVIAEHVGTIKVRQRDARPRRTRLSRLFRQPRARSVATNPPRLLIFGSLSNLRQTCR